MPRRASVSAFSDSEQDDGLQRWPASRALGPEAVKWRVWIGYQLRQWRAQAGPDGRDMKQSQASAKSGIDQAVISLVETGQRRIEVAELVALAHLYKPALMLRDIGRLFSPPTASEWAQVVETRRPDARYAAPPTTAPFLRADEDIEDD